MNNKSIAALIIFVIAANCASVFMVPSGILPDPSRGFEVWRSMQHGASWNHCFEPNLSDLSRDQEKFLAWWTPGQYLLPGLLASLPIGISLGSASELVTLIAIIAGIFGWYRLFQEFGFSDLISLSSCAVLAFSPGTAEMFNSYSGGSVLLLGASPWAFLLCVRLESVTLRRGALLVMAFLAGFFLKSSFLTVALSACAAMAIFGITRKSSWKEIAYSAIKPAAIAAATFATARLAYLRFGETPADLHGFTDSVFRSATFPIAAPLLGATSLDVVLDRLFGHTDFATPEWTRNPFILGSIAVLTLALLVLSIQESPNRRYSAYVLGTFATFAAVHSFLYIFKASVGCNAQYFLVPGMLLLPGILHAARNRGRAVRAAAGVAFAFYLAGGLHPIVRMFHARKSTETVGVEGFSLVGSAALHDTLARLDNAGPKGTVLFELGDPTWILQVRRQRSYVGNVWYRPPATIAENVKHGRPAGLFIVLPKNMAYDGRAQAILRTHVDIASWNEREVGDAVVYFPRAQEVPPALNGLTL